LVSERVDKKSVSEYAIKIKSAKKKRENLLKKAKKP
jgi:hypothetical protein